MPSIAQPPAGSRSGSGTDPDRGRPANGAQGQQPRRADTPSPRRPSRAREESDRGRPNVRDQSPYRFTWNSRSPTPPPRNEGQSSNVPAPPFTAVAVLGLTKNKAERLLDAMCCSQLTSGEVKPGARARTTRLLPQLDNHTDEGISDLLFSDRFFLAANATSGCWWNPDRQGCQHMDNNWPVGRNGR